MVPQCSYSLQVDDEPDFLNKKDRQKTVHVRILLPAESEGQGYPSQRHTEP